MIWLLLSLGCGPRVGDFLGGHDSHTVDTGEDDTATSRQVRVEVLLDGEPVADTTVVQGGNEDRWTTGPDGTVTVTADLTVDGDHVLMASHPEARIGGGELPAEGETLTIELIRFDPSDNEDYVFQPPGTPGVDDSSAYCSHCHVTILEDWYGSPHRGAASNPAVQDLYAGAAAALSDEATCLTAGGAWLEGREPGTGAAGWRCYVGEGVLPALDPDCDVACDSSATAYGACADCHAPGIDGKLGGRDLLEATGIAYEDGVHCDVCHLVESVDPSAPAGVAGRLHVVRPSEVPATPTWPFQPLTFGPYPDVVNPRMGSVERAHFTEGTFCAGCHELDQEALVPGQSLDATRWPEGKLPVHSTWSEWLLTDLGPCQDCHMPPDPDVGNAADLQNIWDVPAGLAAGWLRPPGSVRKHAWYGPRQPDAGLLESAATLTLRQAVKDEELLVTVTVSNVGAGHAIPTGEPLRAIVLAVEASCGGVSLDATGGDAVPDFGGALERQDATGDWSSWPGAEVGQIVRVVERTGAWHQYEGFGRFGDGTLAASEKGMPVEHVVGSATIVAVPGEAVTFDQPLPDGDVAYLVPADGEAYAGSAGFAFARVLTDAEGRRMVPHFLAVDIASDNRLLPDASFTTEHRFALGCSDPDVTATLLHRAWPWELGEERRWGTRDEVMVEVTE